MKTFNRDKKIVKNSGGTVVTDSNFNPVKMTEKQVLTYAKKVMKDINRRFINGFKFTTANVKDCNTHYTFSYT